ncbi:MAG: hypothetical protein WCC06_13045 [Candidatus Aminicenantales bacterium]
MKIIKSINFILIVCILFSLPVPGFAKEKPAPSTWASLPVAIDASEEEWSEDSLIPEDSAGVDLAFRNDVHNLYLLFIIKDKTFLSTLEATGITIYFNPEGKKKKDRGLRFFKRIATADESILALERYGQTLSEEQKKEIKSKPNYVLYDCELIEKENVSAVEVPQGSPSPPPVFKYVRKGESTVFEFRIPLSREDQPSGIGAAPGGLFKIGFEWGGLTKDMQTSRLAKAYLEADRIAQRELRSGAGETESGRTDLTRTSQSQRQSTRPKKYSFWLDVKLASSSMVP